MKTITTKHTPGPIKYHCPKGPWVANKNTVYTEAGELIAACVGLHTARLIAAAPGMVGLLRLGVDALNNDSPWSRKVRALLAQIDGEG